MAKDIFKRLSAGRPPQEPTLPPTPQAGREAARLASKQLEGAHHPRARYSTPWA